ncbi:MAG: ATP-binding protein [Anaerolineae bacterium]
MSVSKPESVDKSKNGLADSRFLLLWLFFSPKRWLDYQQSILQRSRHLTLSVFAYADLGPEKKSAVKQMVRQNALFLQLALIVISGVIISVAVPLNVESSIVLRLATADFINIPAGWINGLAFGASFALIGGFLLALFHSIALGIAAATLGLTLFSIAWGLGWDFGTIIVFGFVGGLLGQIALVATPVRPGPAKSLSLQAVTVIVGMAMGIITLLIVTTLPVIVMRGNVEDVGVRFGLIYGSVLGLSCALLLIVTTGFQLGFERKRSTFIALFVFFGCLALGLFFGSRAFFSEDIVVSIVIGAQTAIVATVLNVVSFAVAEALASPQAGAVSAGISTGLGGVVAFALSFNPESRSGNWGWVFLLGIVSTILGMTFHLWRPILTYPFALVWNLFLVQREENKLDTTGRRMRRHTAFWDEHQWIPLIGLDDYLLFLLEQEPNLAWSAIGEIALSKQSWAAQAAQIEHDARQLAQQDSLEAIGKYHQGLETNLPTTSAATPIIRTFRAISRDVSAALAQTSRYNQKMVLQEAEAQTNGLLFELTRSNDRTTQRFRPIGTQWLNIITGSLSLSSAANEQDEIINPYVVGVPLTRKQQLFVGRTDVSRRLEELLRNQDHPPFLLFGQRRMGKTSLLYQLRWLLPNRIVPVTVDLQGPVALAKDHAGFMYNFGKQMIASANQQDLILPELPRESLIHDPFTTFDDWLDEVGRTLAQKGVETVLLCLDEFETLGHAFAKGTLQEDAILGTVRHMIQHRPQFKLLLAGSHHLDEFPTWANYLINVETIRLGCLGDEQARQLIERPIAGFQLGYAPEAVERILSLTNGHPYLLQLVCAEVVNMKNEGPFDERFVVANGDEVEQVIPDILVRGRQFFVDMQQNQFPAGSLPLLQLLAQSADGLTKEQVGFGADDQKGLQRLISLEYVEERKGSYRLPVELIRYWLLDQSASHFE